MVNEYWMDMMIFILALSNAILLLLKFHLKQIKDFSILGAIGSRLFLASIAFFYAGYDTIHEFGHLGVVILLTSDLIGTLVWFATKKYREYIEETKYMATINALIGKIATIVDNPYISYFVIDEAGVIEFTNAKMSSLFKDRELVGKNLFEFLDWDSVERIRTMESVFCDGYVKIDEETKLKVKINSSMTINGHRTITGSIIEYENTGQC